MVEPPGLSLFQPKNKSQQEDHDNHREQQKIEDEKRITSGRSNKKL
jgi:hypothetical protein